MLQNNFGAKKCEVFWFVFFLFQRLHNNDYDVGIHELSRILRIIQFN